MSANGLTLQYLLIGIVVALSAASLLRKLAPATWGRLLARLAGLLERAANPPLLRAAGVRLRAAIPASVGTACASSGGCSSCGACTVTAPPASQVIELAAPVLRR